MDWKELPRREEQREEEEEECLGKLGGDKLSQRW